MRSSLLRLTMLAAVAVSVSGLMTTGCQSSSSFKAPKSDWFGWGKKKPATSTLGSTKPGNKNLLAPPSSVTQPNPAPSYAQTTDPRAGSQAAPGGHAINTNVANAPAAYGTSNPQSGYATNNNYNTAAVQNSTGVNPNNALPATGYPAAAPATNYTRTASSTTQGFYSPSGYGDRQALPSASGNAGSHTPGPAATGANPGGYAGSYGPSAGNAGTANPGAAREAYTPYGSNPGTAGQNMYNPYAGQTARANAQGAGTTSTPNQNYGPAEAYPATSTSPSLPSYGQNPGYGQGYGATSSTGSPYDSPSRYAAGTSNSSPYGPAAANPGTAQGTSGVPAGGSYSASRGREADSYANGYEQRSSSPNAGASSSYRPGSTGRTTRFGTSDQLNLSSVEGVRSASFNGNSAQGSRASMSDVPGVAGDAAAPDANARSAEAAGSGPSYYGGYHSTTPR